MKLWSAAPLRDPPPFENLPRAFCLFGLYNVYAWLSAVGLRPPLIAVWLPVLLADPPEGPPVPVLPPEKPMLLGKLPLSWPFIAGLFVMDFLRA